MRIIKPSELIGSPSDVFGAKTRRPFPAHVTAAVTEIVQAVRDKGDEALIRYANALDGAGVTSPADLFLPIDQLRAAWESLDEALQKALKHARARVEAYALHTAPHDLIYTDETGTELGALWRPVDSAGLYVPGGKASYPSSVIMNAVPALAAGVGALVMASPPSAGYQPVTLAAAHLCGVKKLLRAGGAQAVAAMAFGTESVPRADVIVGPGNMYVAEAKRQIFGAAGVDMIAGPSEVLVIADDSAVPEHAAADLLSQAEHDEEAKCYLAALDEATARAVIAAVEELLPRLKRASCAEASWRRHGCVMTASDEDEAARIADALAAEHVELLLRKPERLAKKIRHAGAIFAGHHTPEAIGDYIAGPSHVLPTEGTAAWASGISAHTFMKRTSYIRCTPASFAAVAEDARLLAESEGLEAHALSVRCRMTSST